MSNKVFVPQVPMKFDSSLNRMVPKFDTLDQANKFGDIVVLLDRNFDVWNSGSCIAALTEKLASMTNDDYIVPMGSHCYQSFTVLVAATYVDTINFLQWHSRYGEYRVVKTRVPR